MKLKTIQPYFVMNTPKFYQEVLQRGGISHFYMHTADHDCSQVLAVPDGCIDIIFEYEKELRAAQVCGTVLESKKISYEKGKTYFGVRFLPGVHPAILDGDMCDMVDRQLDIKMFLKDEKLLDKMNDATSFETRIQTFLREYNDAQNNSGSHVSEGKVRLLDVIKEAIYKTDGMIKISELETITGYSSRYINKVFQENMGYSPKKFCKIIRFQKLLQSMNQMEAMKLTDIATDFGYYDQAQLIHDFKQFTSVTPKAYRRDYENSAYSERLIETNLLVC